MKLGLLLLALMVAFPAFAQTAPADPGLRVIVTTRDVGRGEVLSEADLGYQMVNATSAFPGIVTSMADVEGKEARRVLRAGEAIRKDDVRNPIVVTRGQTVTMTFAVPGITLTAIGKAITEGGIGDTVTVQNPVSFRQVSAVVTGAGQVQAASTMATISSPAQLAQAGQ